MNHKRGKGDKGACVDEERTWLLRAQSTEQNTTQPAMLSQCLSPSLPSTLHGKPATKTQVAWIPHEEATWLRQTAQNLDDAAMQLSR